MMFKITNNRMPGNPFITTEDVTICVLAVTGNGLTSECTAAAMVLNAELHALEVGASISRQKRWMDTDMLWQNVDLTFYKVAA